ncbi:MAG: hypothetical protein CAF45_003390 [Nitrospira sp. CG24E]|nr:MAG: hypothetical protein CAF45_003390 [Nitrospira sp. CG24E]
MSEHDLEKLLGGFTADTLTSEEKQTLYAAALQDQQLFNVLADEQALKELLSDPDVRRKLLSALEQERTSSPGSPLSWLDWLRRPAGLALAGGLSAAALAVVLGVRIYEDGLRQAAQSVATEEANPLSRPTPQTNEPLAKAKENVAPATDLPKKDIVIDHSAKREQPVPPQPEEQRTSNAQHDSLLQQREQDETRKPANETIASAGKAAGETASLADQRLAAGSTRPAARLESKQIETPTVSARALFYAGESLRPDTRKSHAESAPQASRLERKSEGLSQLGKAAGTVARLRPLGLRYSFVVRGTDGKEQEVDGVSASRNMQPTFLTLEANQEAYVQVWKTVGSSIPKLQLPEKETGGISLKLTVGQRQQLALPIESSPFTLTVRLSQVPFDSVARQKSGMSDRSSLDQLQESITEDNRTNSRERATYIVRQDPSTTAQITVDITFGQ